MEVDEPLLPAAAAPSSEAFKNRMDAVFGALGGSSGLSQGWNVSQISVFKPGSINSDAEEDEVDEEEGEEEAGPERTAAELAGDTNGNAMAEEDKEDMEVRKSASLSFCSALDRECEMDNYDSMAMDSYHAPGAGAPEDKSMEVLPDNYYENRCLKKAARSGGGGAMDCSDGSTVIEAVVTEPEADAAAAGAKFLAEEVERCRAAAISGTAPPLRGGDPISWGSSRTTDPEGQPQASYAGTGSRIQWPSETFLAAEQRVGEEQEPGGAQDTGASAAAAIEEEELAAANRRGGQPLVWSGAGGPGEGQGGPGAGEQQQQQQGAPAKGGSILRQGNEKKRRTVRFAEPEGPQRSSSDGGQVQPRGRMPPPRSAFKGSRGGRGRRQVPDHVVNPHKWTCYVLDEPITVGGGGGGDTARAWLRDRDEEQIGDQAAVIGGGGRHHAQLMPSGTQQSQQQQQEDPQEAEEGGASLPLPLPGQTGLKFVPRKDRATTAGAKGKQVKQKGGGDEHNEQAGSRGGAAPGHNKVPMPIIARDEEDGGDDAMEVEVAGEEGRDEQRSRDGPPSQAKAQRRQFRSKK